MKKYYAVLFFAIAYLAICTQNIFANNYNDPRADRLYLDTGVGIGYWKMGSPFRNLKKGNAVFTPAPGIKIGGGPIDSLPLFIVGEINFHFRISTVDETVARNVPLFLLFGGPGLVFYVSDRFQLAGSIGIGAGIVYGVGLSGNISAAYDFCREYSKHGILLGINLVGSTQFKEDAEQTLFGIGLFLKYTYRTKDWPIFWKRRQ
ncbi:MAG: hypothetical protein Ta2F_07000 [Termitinemataceae bacterium]|nr:MAG: hypothetical protein Ta2F_07000 [Termitinemataceae bacterium]